MFSVSQCTWNDGAAPQIIPILSKPSSGSGSQSTGNGSDVAAPVGDPKSTGLATGAKAGIAIGVVGFAGISGIIAFLFLRPNKQQSPTTPTHTTLSAESGPAPDTGNSSANVIKSETDTDLNGWRLLASHGQDPIALLKLHHQRSELSGAIDVRELPAEDYREGDYLTEDQRIQSEREAHRTPELAGSEWLHELDGGPVPEHLPQISEKHSPGPSPTSTLQHSGSSALQSENGMSPIDLFRSDVPQKSILSPQRSWLDISNTGNTAMASTKETGTTPRDVVSPISPLRRGSGSGLSPLRFKRGGEPFCSSRLDRSGRSNRSLRSEKSDRDLYSAD